ncbi:MAG: hypothetical protein WA130_03110 [Candidatus Methanoperedens sp.]
MKDREIFLGTGILTIMVGFYWLVAQSMKIELGTVTYEISTIFDGGFSIILGIAIVISCLREWDSEKGKKSVKK